MRDSASIKASPLTQCHVINLFIIQGVAHDDLMSVIVVPHLKKNDRTEVGNYWALEK